MAQLDDRASRLADVDQPQARSLRLIQSRGGEVSAGAVGLVAPTPYVEKEIEEFEVDGIKMVFQNTPNTEAPREMNTYYS
jgi:alkyl sulfatase BDS1-like metallo-beta-lactamase superfamily hydrolase